MLRNYLKIAVRRMRREPVYAAINVVGLALGLAVCLLIGLFIYHEFSFDRFHEKSGQIYRVLQEATATSEQRTFATAPIPLAPTLEETYPEVERAVRIDKHTGIVQQENGSFEETLLFVDSTFFDVFTFPLAQGNPAGQLTDPNSVVLSSSAARKYFGRTDVLGEAVPVDMGDMGTHTFTVAGITAPASGPSSITFDMLLPISKLEQIDRSYTSQRWGLSGVVTYLQLSRHTRPETLEPRLTQLLTDRRSNNKIQVDLHLQPLADVHFTPGLFGTLAPERTSRRIYSYLLAAVGLFILAIACINFTTLAIGRSASRAGEVGVRKTIGARRAQLMAQFWGEALLTATCAVLLALLAAWIALPVFRDITGKALSWAALARPYLLAAVGLLVLLVGLVAGMYPAMYLSRFRPVRVLGDLSARGSKHPLIRGLIGVQFIVATGLIIGVIVVSNQLQLIQEKNLGFEEEQIILLEVAKGEDGSQVLGRLRNALAPEPSIRSLSGSLYPIAHPEERGIKDTNPFRAQGQEVRAHSLVVTPGFIDTWGIDLIAGRRFTSGRSSDEPPEGVMVNESFVRASGWERPLDHSLQTIDGTTLPVIGITKDFHFRPLYHEIAPLVLRPSTWHLQALYVRTSPGNPAEAVDLLEKTWQEVAPGQPFSYTFLDQQLQQQYETEQRWAQVLTYAAIFAIGIGCMGLFGLAMLAAGGRTKEIGIRKVLGASAASIVGLLSKDFLKLVVISFMIAAPLAYVGARQWLENFAYRIELEPVIFLGAGVVVILVAFLAISYQSVKAALRNPAESLRSE